MKNKLLILLLIVCGAGAHAQTVSLPDLTNLANLNNSDAHTFLTMAKGFKEQYTQDVSGLTIDHYQVNVPKETLIIGDGVKTGNGEFLHHVSYATTQVKYILKLITEAKDAGLNINFRGADQYKNIYIYDSLLYVVYIYLNADDTGGSVEVRQKDYIGD